MQDIRIGRRINDRRALPLAKLHELLETGPVEPPLIAECHANLDCPCADSRLVNRYHFFVLEVLKAWIDASVRDPRTLHHKGRGAFMMAGKTVRLRSRMR